MEIGLASLHELHHAAAVGGLDVAVIRIGALAAATPHRALRCTVAGELGGEGCWRLGTCEAQAAGIGSWREPGI